MANLNNKRFAIVFLISILFLVVTLGSVSAFNVNTFNNSLTSESLTFTGNQNITRYLEIPNTVASIFDGSLNVSLSTPSPANASLTIGNDLVWFPLNLTKSPGISLTNTATGIFTNYGMLIRADKTVLINSITRDAGVTATNCSLQNTGRGVIASSQFVGDICTFSSPFILSKGTSYYLVVDSGAQSYTMHYRDGNSYPIPGSYITWLNGTDGSPATNGAYNIINIAISGNNTMNNLASIVNKYLNSTYLVGSNYDIPFIFHSDNGGVLNYSNIAFNNTRIIFNSVNYTNSTYETSASTFQLNITTSGEQDLSADLIYDGVTYAATNLGNNINAVFTRTIDIPIVNSIINKTFFWTVYSGTTPTNSSLYNQTVNPLYFQLCNSTVNTTLLNFTFIDEVTLSNINGSLNPLTGTYYLGSGSVSKTLNFINASYNPNYTFCSNANQTLYFQGVTATYSGNAYPSRYFASSFILNPPSVNNQLLYLLSSTNGISVFIQLTDSQGNRISGVTVQAYRVINGNNTLVSQDTSGSDGGVSFFLNPNYVHTIVATKSGCGTTTASFTPTQNQYTVTMACGNAASNNYFISLLQGINWRRGPLTGLSYLSTTPINYTYSVSSQYANIIGAKFELINQSIDTLTSQKTIVNSTSVLCGPTQCDLSVFYKPNQEEELWGRYYVNTGKGLVLVEGDAHWVYTIQTNASSTSTLKNVLSDFTSLFDQSWVDVNGQWQPASVNSQNRAEYSRIVAFFLLFAICIALANKFTNYDSYNPGITISLLAGVVFIMSIYNGINGHGYFYYSNLVDSTKFYGANWVNNYILAMTLIFVTAGGWFEIMSRKRI